MHREKERKIDCRNNLTYVNSVYSMLAVRFKDIVFGISQQTSRKCEELAKDREELNQLRDGYQRYRELSAGVESKERSVKIGFALLLNASGKGDPATDSALERFSDAELSLNESDIDLSKISLWRIIREIVRQAVKVRVFELEEHLKAFGVRTSRAAVESALATHSKEFRITKNGREKYVSLKGA